MIEPGCATPSPPASRAPKGLPSRAFQAHGVDVVIEATGTVAQLEQVVSMTRSGGSTVLVGASRFGATVAVSPAALVIEDMCIRGSPFGGTRALRDFPRYVELIESGRLDMASTIFASNHARRSRRPLGMPTGDAIGTVLM